MVLSAGAQFEFEDEITGEHRVLFAGQACDAPAGQKANNDLNTFVITGDFAQMA